MKSTLRNPLRKIFFDLTTSIKNKKNFHEIVDKNKNYKRVISFQENIKKIEINKHNSLFDYFENTDPAFSSSIQKFINGIPTNGFNPGSPYIDSNYFVETDSYAELSKHIDTVIAHPELRRNIVFIGNKGSGKTILQNVLLSNKNDAFNANKIFWVRCDAAKLFQIWNKINIDLVNKRLIESDVNSATIDEYLNCQLVYVLAKYHNDPKRIFIGNIFTLIKNNNLCFEKPEGYADSHEVSNTSIASFIEEISAIEIRNHEKNDESKSYMIEMFESSHRSRARERRRWNACAKAIRAFLVLNKIYLLRILDGVDNVHINDEISQLSYNKITPLISDFILENPVSKYEIRMAAMRERTYIDCKTHSPLPNTGLSAPLKKIVHVLPNAEQVFNLRMNYYLNNEKSTSDLHARKILKQIISINKDWLTDIFHGNVRNFLYNSASLTLHLKLRELSGVHDLENQIAIQRSRNLFLNGRLYIDTIKDWAEINTDRGFIIFNPFIGDKDVIPTTLRDWTGLSLLRILECIQNSTTRMSETTVVEKINKYFDYPENLLRSAISNARAFGYIDSHESIQSGHYLSISPLGRYLLNDFIINPDSLYYFSLDSYMPKILLENNLIFCHTTSIVGRSDYRVAAVSSSITFIYFLYARNILDKCIHENKFKTNNTSDSDYYNFSFFSDRQLNRIAARLGKIIDQFDEVDSKKFKDYFERLQKIFN